MYLISVKIFFIEKLSVDASTQILRVIWHLLLEMKPYAYRMKLTCDQRGTGRRVDYDEGIRTLARMKGEIGWGESLVNSYNRYCL